MTNVLDSFKNALNGALDNNPLFNLGYPLKSLSSVTDFEKLKDMSLGALASDLASSVAKINGLVHNTYCIGQSITDPATLLNMLDQMAGNLVATAIDMAGRIFNCIEGQIKGAISKVTGAISKLINSVLDFLNVVENLLEQVDQLITNLAKMGEVTFSKFTAQDDCEYFLSSVAQCLLNKLIGSNLENFEQKVTSKINKLGGNVNQAITEELSSTKNLTNFINKEAFMANKASTLLSMF